MYISDNIPASAQRCEFRADNGKRAFYYVWFTPAGKWPAAWVWSALGNTGEDEDEWKAREAARRWIRDGS